MSNLKTGDLAPEFTGKNQFGEKISLSQFKGKKVILYFYPKDNTPGCTAEACNFNENFEDLTQNGFVVIGVSADSEKSHKGFAEKYNLRFHLIADTEKTILQAYNAWGEKSMYGKKYMGIIRKTFVISEEGILESLIEKVETKNATAQVFKTLSL